MSHLERIREMDVPADHYYVMGSLIAVTNKAIYLEVKEFEDEGGRIIKPEPETRQEWLPLSQIKNLERDMFHNAVGDDVSMTIPAWLAKDKGFVS